MANEPETTGEPEGEQDEPQSEQPEGEAGEGPFPCGRDEIWDPVQQKCVPRT